MSDAESYRYLKVEASAFKCGVQLQGGRCVNTSTILRYMVGWSEQRVMKHLKRKRWKVSEIDPELWGGK